MSAGACKASGGCVKKVMAWEEELTIVVWIHLPWTHEKYECVLLFFCHNTPFHSNAQAILRENWTPISSSRRENLYP